MCGNLPLNSTLSEVIGINEAHTENPGLTYKSCYEDGCLRDDMSMSSRLDDLMCEEADGKFIHQIY